MKSARKIILIVATVFVAAGILLMTGAWAVAGFDLGNLSTDPHDWKLTETTLTPESERPHRSITVYDSSEQVRIVAAEGDAVEVSYWESAARTRTAQVSESAEGDIAISASQTDSLAGRINEMTSVPYVDTTTWIKVPRSFTGSITVETEDATIAVEGLSGTADLVLRSDKGSVFASNLDNVGSIIAETDSAGIGLDGITANGTVSIVVHDGIASSLNDVTAQQVKASVEDSDLQLIWVKADSIDLCSEDGEIALSSSVAGSVNVRTEKGDIRTSSLTGENIALTSESGRIRGTLAGSKDDYAVTSTERESSTQAPAGLAEGAKKLELKTRYGDIDLGFDGKSDSLEDITETAPEHFKRAVAGSRTEAEGTTGS